MKRPWHVWTIFVLCLLVAVAGMGWLTVKSLELEREQAMLSLRADFEGDVRLALRRMDQFLADLFAEESAWPHFAYQPFYVPQLPPTDDVTDGAEAKPARPEVEPIASPLLNAASPLVNLYFQSDLQNNWVSPMCPPAGQEKLAEQNGVGADQRLANNKLLAKCQDFVKPDQLLACLPEAQELAVEPTPAVAWNEAAPNAPAAAPDQTNAEPQFPQQAANQAAPQPSANAPAQQVDDAQLEQQLNVAQSIVQNQGKVLEQRVQPEAQMQRANAEYLTRKQQFDVSASKWNTRIQQRGFFLNNDALAGMPDELHNRLLKGNTSPKVVEGRSRPVWIGDELVLARRVKVDGKTNIQGVWLNWNAIQRQLGELVKDLLPDLKIVPVTAESSADIGRLLAALPAKLVVSPPRLDGNAATTALTPMQITLLAAWACLLVAALAAAILLAGVMSLSERRATFVSAVTHELRTPLTTFRMYAEMLAEDMVPDPERRQSYLNTLKTEADRLFHLVENVLSYARLERGPARSAKRAMVTVDQLLDGMQRRLDQRAARAEMELIVEAADDVRSKSLATDISAVEQILVNLVDNSCKYAAAAEDRRIHLRVESQGGSLLLRLCDHGPGIQDAERGRLFRPFTKSASEAAHSAPGVGLGLALCRRLAKQIGGRLWLEPANGDGACFVLKLPSQSS